MRVLVLIAGILGAGCRGHISTVGSFITDIRVKDQALVVDHCVIDNAHQTAASRIAAAFSSSSYKLEAVKCWRDQVDLPPAGSTQAETPPPAKASSGGRP